MAFLLFWVGLALVGLQQNLRDREIGWKFINASSPTQAAACRDAKGKFIKCPPAAAAATTRCKDAKGKFAEYGTLGPIPVK